MRAWGLAGTKSPPRLVTHLGGAPCCGLDSS